MKRRRGARLHARVGGFDGGVSGSRVDRATPQHGAAVLETGGRVVGGPSARVGRVRSPSGSLLVGGRFVGEAFVRSVFVFIAAPQGDRDGAHHGLARRDAVEPPQQPPHGGVAQPRDDVLPRHDADRVRPRPEAQIQRTHARRREAQTRALPQRSLRRPRSRLRVVAAAAAAGRRVARRFATRPRQLIQPLHRRLLHAVFVLLPPGRRIVVVLAGSIHEHRAYGGDAGAHGVPRDDELEPRVLEQRLGARGELRLENLVRADHHARVREPPRERRRLAARVRQEIRRADRAPDRQDDGAVGAVDGDVRRGGEGERHPIGAHEIRRVHARGARRRRRRLRARRVRGGAARPRRANRRREAASLIFHAVVLENRGQRTVRGRRVASRERKPQRAEVRKWIFKFFFFGARASSNVLERKRRVFVPRRVDVVVHAGRAVELARRALAVRGGAPLLAPEEDAAEGIERRRGFHPERLHLPRQELRHLQHRPVRVRQPDQPADQGDPLGVAALDRRLPSRLAHRSRGPRAKERRLPSLPSAARRRRRSRRLRRFAVVHRRLQVARAAVRADVHVDIETRDIQEVDEVGALREVDASPRGRGGAAATRRRRGGRRRPEGRDVSPGHHLTRRLRARRGGFDDAGEGDVRGVGVHGVRGAAGVRHDHQRGRAHEGRGGAGSRVRGGGGGGIRRGRRGWGAVYEPPRLLERAQAARGRERRGAGVGGSVARGGGSGAETLGRPPRRTGGLVLPRHGATGGRKEEGDGTPARGRPASRTRERARGDAPTRDRRPDPCPTPRGRGAGGEGARRRPVARPPFVRARDAEPRTSPRNARNTQNAGDRGRRAADPFSPQLAVS